MSRRKIQLQRNDKYFKLKQINMEIRNYGRFKFRLSLHFGNILIFFDKPSRVIMGYFHLNFDEKRIFGIDYKITTNCF
jgi:hypothetical protein